MSAKNFIIKNGLTIGSTEAIDSSGDLTAAAFGTAANEAIDDRGNALLTAGTGYALADFKAGDITATTLTAASLSYPSSDGSANQVLQTNGSGTLSFANRDLSSGTLTTTSTSATTLDSIAIASYRGAKYSITVSDATGGVFEITEVHVIHDGSSASITQFGTVLQGGSSELGTFTVDINSGNLRLRVASASTNSTVYNFKRIDHSV